VLGDAVFQGEKLLQPCFFGFPVQFDVFPALGKSHRRQKGDDDNLDEGVAFLPVDPRVFNVVKKIDNGWYGLGTHQRLQSPLYRLFLSLLYSFFNALALAMQARTLDYSGKTNVGLTLKGNSAGRSVQLSGTGSLFTVNSGLTLTLESLTLRGRENTYANGNTHSLVRVNGGSMEMRQDSLITENYTTSSSSYISGGGVYVGSGAFTMQDNASVSNNRASGGGGLPIGSYGGGVYISDGTFTKKGGTIYGDTDTTHTAGSTENTSTNGNGHAVYGGGKKRNSTADTAVNLYAKYTSGAWTYNDDSAGGVGDTSANWE
jgi:hypothetical protein